MNRKDALAILLKKLQSSVFAVHPGLVAELLGLIAHTGQEAQIFSVLIARLEYLAEHPYTAHTDYPTNYERIDEEIYSMHITVKGHNLRILYGYSGAEIRLLTAFHERSGKTKTGYKPHLSTAHQRLLEDFNDNRR